MKDTEFKKIIEGKDLTKAEDVQSIVDSINDLSNTLIAKKEKAFDEKYQTLENSKNQEVNSWKNRSYIYKNVNNELNDEDVNDLMTLVNARMSTNAKLKFEDAVKEVSAKRGFQKKVETPKAVEAPKAEPVKVDVKPAEEPVEQPQVLSTGVRAMGNSSEGVDYSDNSSEAQLARYNAFIGKK